MKTYQLWARVGVTINIKEDQIEEFMKDQKEFVQKGILNGSIDLDGDTYFPEEVEENEEFESKIGYLGWDVWLR